MRGRGGRKISPPSLGLVEPLESCRWGAAVGTGAQGRGGHEEVGVMVGKERRLPPGACEEPSRSGSENRGARRAGSVRALEAAGLGERGCVWGYWEPPARASPLVRAAGYGAEWPAGLAARSWAGAGGSERSPGRQAEVGRTDAEGKGSGIPRAAPSQSPPGSGPRPRAPLDWSPLPSPPLASLGPRAGGVSPLREGAE